MHARCRLAGGALLMAGCAHAAPACPPARAEVVERFTSADCPACWASPTLPGTAADWVLDWITPRTADAALAPAALPEATERAQRSGLALPDTAALVLHRHGVPAGARPRLRVQAGLPLNGYLGLQFESRGPTPPGSSGWLALVEVLPAGTEGSVAGRRLVRAVVGPLPMAAARAGQPIRHLHAVRWPDGALPGRVQAQAWIEAADGRMLALASDACPRR
ncbi:MAG: hypothetical protein HY855_04265 [Burkholderiales bacterium]|nr:hypothetical protein [Burkholderiales bacterium]